jgi:hypothetical protein
LEISFFKLKSSYPLYRKLFFKITTKQKQNKKISSTTTATTTTTTIRQILPIPFSTFN